MLIEVAPQMINKVIFAIYERKRNTAAGRFLQ